MSRTAILTIDGNKFSSIKEAAQHYGLHPSTVGRRIRSGWSVDQALNLEAKPKRNAHNAKKIITSKGSFSSLKKAAQNFGVPYARVQRRLELGWCNDQALGISPPPNQRKNVIYSEVKCEGKTFLSIEKLAQHYKLTGRLVRKRIHSGWSVEQAVELQPPPPRFRNHHGQERDHVWKARQKIDGKILPKSVDGVYQLYVITNVKNGKEYIGITTNDIKARWRGHLRQAKIGTKWRLYNAIRFHGQKSFKIKIIRDDAKDFKELQDQEIYEIQKRDSIKKGYNSTVGGGIGTSRPITIDQKHFPSHNAAANFYGVDPIVFSMRLGRLGWSPEEAAEIKRRPGYKRGEITVNGITYKSLKSACEALGKKYKTVHKRVAHMGWTVEEALELKRK